MNVISRENYRRPKNSWRSQKNSVWKLSGKINFCIFSDPFLTTVHNLKCLLFPFWSLRAEIFIKEYILSLCQINVAKSTCILSDPFLTTVHNQKPSIFAIFGATGLKSLPEVPCWLYLKISDQINFYISSDPPLTTVHNQKC